MLKEIKMYSSFFSVAESNDLTIIKATSAHRAELIQLAIDTYFENYADFYDNDISKIERIFETQIPNDLNNPQILFLLLKKNNKLIGYAKINLDGAENCLFLAQHRSSPFLDKLYISKDHQSRGYGKKLIAKACEIIALKAEAEEKELASLCVLVFTTSAKNFYTKMGFECTHYFTPYYSTTGDPTDSSNELMILSKPVKDLILNTEFINLTNRSSM